MCIAEIILSQLGGNRMGQMIGVKQFLKDDNSLMFRFKMSKHSNYCKITLNSMNLYNIEFHKIHGSKCRLIESFENIDSDNLKSIFESTVKLNLSLF